MNQPTTWTEAFWQLTMLGLFALSPVVGCLMANSLFDWLIGGVQ